jgi:hypothetical protein
LVSFPKKRKEATTKDEEDDDDRVGHTKNTQKGGGASSSSWLIAALLAFCSPFRFLLIFSQKYKNPPIVHSNNTPTLYHGVPGTHPKRQGGTRRSRPERGEDGAYPRRIKGMWVVPCEPWAAGEKRPRGIRTKAKLFFLLRFTFFADTDQQKKKKRKKRKKDDKN